jgi:hypothetical protein
LEQGDLEVEFGWPVGEKPPEAQQVTLLQQPLLHTLEFPAFHMEPL